MVGAVHGEFDGALFEFEDLDGGVEAGAAQFDGVFAGEELVDPGVDVLERGALGGRSGDFSHDVSEHPPVGRTVRLGVVCVCEEEVSGWSPLVVLAGVPA